LWVSGFGLPALLVSGLLVQGFGVRVSGPGFLVQGLGIRVQGFEFGEHEARLRVYPAQCIDQIVSKSQDHHKIVNLLFTVTK